MVGKNTIVNDDSLGKSPLLPIRHQPDFFVCDVFDAAMKGDSASMEHPIFSLSKKPDMKVRRYENGRSMAEIRPSVKGVATVFDRDILIYCISQLVEAINNGQTISQRIRLRAHDLLVATNRDTSGRGYLQLREAFERLQGTQIVTNIITGDTEEFDVFGLIDRAKIIRETRDGRMQEVEIVLSDWVFRAVEASEVLTLDKRYFQLAKPLERRLYEIARKHVGYQSLFRISLEKLRNKCGSQSTPKEFKRLLQNIINADQLHDHMPGYCFNIVAEIVEMRPKAEQRQISLIASDLTLTDAVRVRAKEIAPGLDIYVIEDEWRAWIEKRGIQPRDSARHFLAFCKRKSIRPAFI